MNYMRIGLVSLLIAGLSTPALAGDLRESAAKAANQQTAPTESRGPIPKAYLWTGAALFVGGMTVGLYGFLNNKNGEFPEFGEATSTNKGLGAAGLITAFAGGTVLALGARHSSRSPSVTFGRRRMTVTKTVQW
jgi:hypothetical protein